MPADEPRVVERFVDALLSRDWVRLRATLTPDVRREGFDGPERDAVVGREPYLQWASELIDPLAVYAWAMHRLEYSETGTSAFLEATSTYRVHATDEPFGYHMAVIFDLTADGLISQVSLYWKTPDQRLPRGTIAEAAVS
jgi:hypothetical protein